MEWTPFLLHPCFHFFFLYISIFNTFTFVFQCLMISSKKACSFVFVPFSPLITIVHRRIALKVTTFHGNCSRMMEHNNTVSQSKMSVPRHFFQHYQHHWLCIFDSDEDEVFILYNVCLVALNLVSFTHHCHHC